MTPHEEYATLVMRLPEVYTEVSEAIAGSAECIAELKAYKVRTEELLLLLGQRIEDYEIRQRQVVASLTRVAEYMEAINRRHDEALEEDSEGEGWRGDA